MEPIFKTTGPLDYDEDRAIYVEREELDEILAEIRRPYVEGYVALLGPRQTGKTTLLFRVYRELKRQDEPVAFLDLSAYRMESLVQSYAHAALKIWEELEESLTSAGRLHAVAALVDSPIRFREYLLELARACRAARIVVLLDEAGPFMASLGFFETLRSISASGGRESERAFKKYLFVFSGTVDLHELTTGQNSPLANVCKSVYLDGFGLAGTAQLVSLLEQIAPVGAQVAPYVHSQTRGHPYLTQRICSLIEQEQLKPQRIGRRTVDRAIDRIYEGDENLRYITLQLERYPQARDLLRQIVVDGADIPFTLVDPRVARLFVMGAVRRGAEFEREPGSRRRARCEVCNPIYEYSLRAYLESVCAQGGMLSDAVAQAVGQTAASLSAVEPRYYIDFHVRVLAPPDPGQPHPVMADGWAGLGTGQLGLDVSDPALWACVDRLRQLRIAPDDLRDLGTILWQGLFASPDIARRWAACQAEAGSDRGVRIKLEIDPPELAALPWEYLYDPERQTFLALSPRTPITRYARSEDGEPLLPILQQPLRILVISATPAGTLPLDAEREQRQIVEAMAPLQRAGKVAIEVLDHATVRGLQTMLRRPFHVLHYIGHGVFDEQSETGMLALEDEDGEVHAVSAAQLHYLLRDTTVRLAVLNACLTARGAAGQSIAGALMRAGLSAALAMEFEIAEHSAIAFAGEFYRALADGWPVDAAVSEGRKAMMFATDLHAMDWGVPVLYMRARDGMLFCRPDRE